MGRGIVPRERRSAVFLDAASSHPVHRFQREPRHLRRSRVPTCRRPGPRPERTGRGLERGSHRPDPVPCATRGTETTSSTRWRRPWRRPRPSCAGARTSADASCSGLCLVLGGSPCGADHPRRDRSTEIERARRQPVERATGSTWSTPSRASRIRLRNLPKATPQGHPQGWAPARARAETHRVAGLGAGKRQTAAATLADRLTANVVPVAAYATP